MNAKQPLLYFLILFLMAFVVIVALGGGLFGQQKYWIVQWQHQAFANLCHQIPERSFWIGGQPMAVCSRCLGIYSGFLLGWMLLPLIAASNIARSFSYKKILLGAVIINLSDILGNLLGFWQNTLISRLTLGWLTGLAAAGLFSGSFFSKNNKQKGKYYGALRTTGTNN